MKIPRHWSVLASFVVLVLAGAFAFGEAIPRGHLETNARQKPTDDMLESNRRARGAVDRGLRALGGEKALQAAREIALRGEGTFDDGAWFQGLHPNSKDEITYSEVLVRDAEHDRTGWENQYTRKDGTHDWMRYVYKKQAQTQLAHLVDHYAFQLADPATGGTRQRLERMIPHVLLAEARTHWTSLRYLGETGSGATAVERVVVALPAVQILTLEIGRTNGLLLAFEYVVDALVTGSTVVRWQYDPYRVVEGLGPYPTGYSISVGGRVLKRVRYTSVRIGNVADAEVFCLPEGLTPVVIPLEPASEPAEAPEDPPVKEVGRGLYVVQGLRGGFHVLFAEFKDFVVALEAPTGWLELHEVPASNVEPGATTDSLAETYIRLIQQKAPGKPIRYVVLSHFHSDHSGGIRPFLREGTTVVATATTRAVVEQIARTSAPALQPRYKIVSGRLVISDGEQELELLEMGPNEHCDGMLVAHFPKQKLVYIADFFLPSSPRTFPLLSHRPMMRFFVRWLDSRGLAPELIIAAHGSGEATAEHLAKVRGLKE